MPTTPPRPEPSPDRLDQLLREDPVLQELDRIGTLNRVGWWLGCPPYGVAAVLEFPLGSPWLAVGLVGLCVQLCGLGLLFYLRRRLKRVEERELT